MPVIPALKRLRQEDVTSSRLDCIGRPYLKKKKKWETDPRVRTNSPFHSAFLFLPLNSAFS
jgi:hypothetical protein